VLTFRYGQFSHLWVDMMQRLGLDVTVVDRPWGEGADEAILQVRACWESVRCSGFGAETQGGWVECHVLALAPAACPRSAHASRAPQQHAHAATNNSTTCQEILAKDTGKQIKAVAVVHNETTTGVTSDIKGVRGAMDAANHPALLLVDGVSSIGALDFRFDDWRVDVAVTGSQKALSLPTGLGLVCASNKVRRGRRGKRRQQPWWQQLWRRPCLACRSVAAASSTPTLLLSRCCCRAECWKALTSSAAAATSPHTHAQALEAMKTAKLPRCYYDFEDQLKTNPAGSTPYTPSLSMLYGLKESIRCVCVC
jgi:aspartate aminotransferase-like enzyme